MAGVSKDKLRKEITAILKNADLNKITAKKVRQTLEEKLDVNLTDQKKLVDDLVMEFLNDKETASKKSKKTDSEDDDEGDEENGADEDDDNDDDEEAETEKRKAQKRGAQRNNKADSESDEPSDDDDEEEYGPKKKAKTTAKKGAGKKKKKGSDNDSDEDWGKNKKRSGGGGAKRGGGGGGGGGGGKGGYTKTCNLSPELAKLVGKDSMARHEVVKKVWAIIKERDLYDPDNKQYAICDNDLFQVIGVKRFRAFSMMKYLKNHFLS